jgi:hypothetical protein
MRRNVLITALAASIVVAGVSLAVPASAQNIPNRWRNADTTHGTFYLGVSGGPTCNRVDCGLHNGANIIAWQFGQEDQLWWPESGNGPVEDYYFNIDNGLSMCLGVAAGSLNAGTPLVIWQCNNALDQSWKIVSAEAVSAPFPGCSVFFNNKSGMVMGVSGGNVQNGTKVIQWPLFQGTPGGNAGWHPDQFWCLQSP